MSYTTEHNQALIVKLNCLWIIPYMVVNFENKKDNKRRQKFFLIFFLNYIIKFLPLL
jgi:hypothetical protein